MTDSVRSVCVLLSLAWLHPVAAESLNLAAARTFSHLASGDESFSPVIGILAMPEFKPHPDQAKRSYLASSYVKWLEGHGARIIPLVHDAPRAVTERLLGRINGVVFPGGAFPMEPAYESFSRLVFDRAVKDKIPAWGECLGLLQFLLFTSGQASPGPVTGSWDAVGGNKPLMRPVTLTEAGKNWSGLANMSVAQRSGFEHEPWAWHSHALSVSVSAFEHSAQLPTFWNLIAVGEDRKGASFVDIVQAKQLPIVGLMFHPEKLAFEYFPERTGPAEAKKPVRDAVAIEAMSMLSLHFVTLCRSFRGLMFSAEDFVKWNIHNWVEESTAPNDSVFETQFFFPSANKPNGPPVAGDALPLTSWGHRL